MGWQSCTREEKFGGGGGILPRAQARAGDGGKARDRVGSSESAHGTGILGAGGSRVGSHGKDGGGGMKAHRIGGGMKGMKVHRINGGMKAHQISES